MRKIICDRCGRDITPLEKLGYIAVNWRSSKTGDLTGDNPYEAHDYCPACMEEILRVIDFKAAAPEADPDPGEPAEAEAVDEIKQAPAPKKKPIDKGKVFALNKAQWPIKKIADEMGVSTVRIGQILKEAQDND